MYYIKKVLLKGRKWQILTPINSADCFVGKAKRVPLSYNNLVLDRRGRCHWSHSHFHFLLCERGCFFSERVNYL